MMISSLFLHSQGCSDAGACSIQTFDFELNPETSKGKILLNFNQTLALGEKFIFISQTILSMQYNLSSSTYFELRTPFIFTYGNLGYTSGVGDLILSASQDFFKNKNFQLTAIIAGRLKTNHANFNFDNLPLPMAYQTSLGTNDIILGMQYSRTTWNLYVAYQHPFRRNSNKYLVPDDEANPNKQYFESAYLKRGDDLYLRGQYYLNLNKNNDLKFTMLNIYRIQKSEIIVDDETVILDGSSGITINLGVTYTKQIKHNRELSLILAFPVIDREYRADGLTRNIVIGISLRNL
ncbi:MAG: hypothetical protein C0591_07755 [Marinilabiliales bacterium]|nr:MAG: hypothetical protein C0591_07755 [Marinilabiliales bacterium]